MNNNEIAKKVVDRMLETIKAEGVLPWAKPWTSGSRSVEIIDGWTEITVPVQHWSRSGRPYTGINPLLLNFSGKVPLPREILNTSSRRLFTISH